MLRADLMALTPDDLATLSNRGTVKRAQKELEAQSVTCRLEELQNGDLIFHWSDGIICRFPAGATMSDAICSSGTVGISRHVIRSVLFYQDAMRNGSLQISEAVRSDFSPHATAGPKFAESDVSVPTATTSEVQESPPHPYPTRERLTYSEPNAIANPADPRPGHSIGAQSWDPGTITDDELITRFNKHSIAKARQRFEQGVIVELTRGTKPIARFLDDGCTVRFLVPGDLRYVSADCAESLYSVWVPLAVWAFRELAEDRLAGLVCTQTAPPSVPADTLQQVETLLDEFCTDGLAGLSATWLQRADRAEQNLRQHELVWPAEILVDLIHQIALYRQHDAQFDPQRVVLCVGELIARTEAIRNGISIVPQTLIRGSKSDRPTEITGSRMIGVGCGVRHGKRLTTIHAYLQDVDSGTLVAVERTYPLPDANSTDAPPSFDDLADRSLMRDISLTSLASSQLLIKSGKRTPGGLLILPRTVASLTTHPQAYQWEQLKPPFAVDSLAQLAARLESLPPSFLRPRRRTEDLFVVAVTSIDEIQFDVVHQRLTAKLTDVDGQSARLVHPYTNQGREGFNRLLTALEQRGAQARFISGHVRSTRGGIEMRPLTVVFEEDHHRYAVPAWISGDTNLTDTMPVKGGESGTIEQRSTDSEATTTQFMQQLRDMLADALLTGVRDCPISRWTALKDHGEHLGFVRIPRIVAKLVEPLTLMLNDLKWDPSSAIRQIKYLCLLSRVADE